MGDGATQFLRGHRFVRHRLHHVGSGDEHVGAVLHHEDKVGHGRRIDGAAGARSHDHGDLRHHAGGQHVALEHVGVTAQRGHAFLDARAARVVQADHGCADLHGLIHDLADLLGVRLGQRAAEHGEILAEDKHQSAVDRAVAGDHAVTGTFLSAMPKSMQRCSTNISHSSKLSSSSSSSMRSRAVSLPRLCWASIRCLAAAQCCRLRFSSSSSMISCMFRPYTVAAYGLSRRSRIMPSTSLAASRILVPGPEYAPTHRRPAAHRNPAAE